MGTGRKFTEALIVLVLVAASLFVGKAAGSLVFKSERGAYAAPEALPPASLAAHTADGVVAPIDLAHRSRPLMVLLLSVDCPFCLQNLPRWRDLVAAVEAAGPAGPEILVLSLSDAEETAAYLTEHGLPPDFVLVTDEDIEPLDVPGTPATILFPASGGPMLRWVGVLNDTQTEIVRAWTASAAEKIAVP